MAWQPPEWARSAQQLSDRWLGTCRKFNRHEQFFQSLGWGDRLSQLFAVACTRAAFAKRLNARSRDLVALVEQEADGLVSHEVVVAAADALGEESEAAEKSPVHQAAYWSIVLGPHFAAGYFATLKRQRELFGKILAAMIGPGWSWSATWKTSAAVDIARGVYDDHAWDRMPILSDALTDAGCDDSRVRGYCRGDGPFFRGCWILEALLDKRE